MSEVPSNKRSRVSVKMRVKRKTPVELDPKVASADLIKTRHQLLRFFDIQEWDALLISDGSATTWDKTAGWAAVLVQQTVLMPQILSGSWSRGTNNVAELMAVFQALFYLAENDFGLKELGYLVHVFTDSQYVARGLNNLEAKGTLWAAGTSANRPLWLGVLGCRRKGLVIRGHYVPRDTIRPNQLCHDLANFARIRAKQPLTDLVGAGWDIEKAMDEDET